MLRNAVSSNIVHMIWSNGSSGQGQIRCMGSMRTWLDSTFKNFEKSGLPKDAGVESDDGFDLERMHRLLDGLNNPHASFPSVVHIAGTKGKGSIACMVSSILSSAGHRVGTYTSPHVVSIGERMLLNGIPMKEQDFERLIERYRSNIEQVQDVVRDKLTYFEVITALAFKFFAEEKVDIAVIETGLGGSRDATNVFSPQKNRSLVSVISPIGMEHAEALGGSLESIATSKAGIMKPGCPVVLAPQAEQIVAKILLERASLLNCPVVRVEDCIKYDANGISTELTQGQSRAVKQTASLQIIDPQLSKAVHAPQNEDITFEMGLIGRHQLDNAAVTIATVGTLALSNVNTSNLSSRKITDDSGDIASLAASHGLHSEQRELRINLDALKEGIQTARLPGRLQILEKQNDQPWIILDGAHTKESANKLVQSLQDLFPLDKNNVALIVAMARDKHHVEVLNELKRLRPCVAVFTEVSIADGKDRSAAPGSLVGAWQLAKTKRNDACPSNNGPFRCRELIQASLSAAFDRARMELKAQVDKKDAVVVVTGSLHVVGAALNQLSIAKIE